MESEKKNQQKNATKNTTKNSVGEDWIIAVYMRKHVHADSVTDHVTKRQNAT